MTLKKGIEILKAGVDRQLEFIEWLKSEDMYNTMDSVHTMNKMQRIWEKVNQTIYMVTGHSGMYDNYQHWVAKAFFDKDKADDYRINCNAEAFRIKEEIKKFEVDSGLGDTSRFMDTSNLKDPVKFWDDYTAITQSNTVDPKFIFDTQDMGYLIEEIQVEV